MINLFTFPSLNLQFNGGVSARFTHYLYPKESPANNKLFRETFDSAFLFKREDGSYEYSLKIKKDLKDFIKEVIDAEDNKSDYYLVKKFTASIIKNIKLLSNQINPSYDSEVEGEIIKNGLLNITGINENENNSAFINGSDYFSVKGSRVNKPSNKGANKSYLKEEQYNINKYLEKINSMVLIFILTYHYKDSKYIGNLMRDEEEIIDFNNYFKEKLTSDNIKSSFEEEYKKKIQKFLTGDDEIQDNKNSEDYNEEDKKDQRKLEKKPLEEYFIFFQRNLKVNPGLLMGLAISTKGLEIIREEEESYRIPTFFISIEGLIKLSEYNLLKEKLFPLFCKGSLSDLGSISFNLSFERLGIKIEVPFNKNLKDIKGWEDLLKNLNYGLVINIWHFKIYIGFNPKDSCFFYQISPVISYSTFTKTDISDLRNGREIEGVIFN